ncbi:DUF1273 domain-containing protein [Alkalicoccobacillus porphyridii]|uniref:UPF0398 protein FN960_08280 n=1 Tax=Alkalicoccobacillus porphyridii TaxID=2597270 RepID=A0A554A043_9BACI|nr:DUF1273 domain-containing protein [Alkalicoccobacillus porphyridii]TSB47006.1 DUF1273 domain-containing protein [Alkalicoccobacillus porphyridii]
MYRSVLITGYKPHELGVFDKEHPGIKYIKKAIEYRLIPLIEEGTEWFVISGQLGVELWAAEVVLELKSTYSHIKLAVLPPFLNQEDQWKEASQQQYRLALEQADLVKPITNRVYESPAQLRQKNDFLITKSDALLVLYDEDHPGTPTFYLEPARKKQTQAEYDIIYITPDDIEDARRNEEDQF